MAVTTCQKISARGRELADGCGVLHPLEGSVRAGNSIFLKPKYWRKGVESFVFCGERKYDLRGQHRFYLRWNAPQTSSLVLVPSLFTVSLHASLSTWLRQIQSVGWPSLMPASSSPRRPRSNSLLHYTEGVPETIRCCSYFLGSWHRAVCLLSLRPILWQVHIQSHPRWICQDACAFLTL